MSNYGRWEQGRQNITRSGGTGENALVEAEGQNFAHQEKEATESRIETDASIGLSVSVGENAPYGAQKYDVTVWCTLPSHPDRKSRDEAFEECKQEVYKRLGQLKSEVCETFGLDHPSLKK